MNERVSEIAARCKAATAGAWRVAEEPNPLNDVGRATFPNGVVEEPERWIVTEWDHPQLEGPECIITLGHSPYLKKPVALRINPADAEFIAHAREDVPYLLAQLAAAESALAAIGKLTDMPGTHPPEKIVEQVKGLRENYNRICERLQDAVQRHHLGLGGEMIDALVVEALDVVADDSARLDFIDECNVDVDWLVPNSDPPVVEVCTQPYADHHADGFQIREAIDALRLAARAAASPARE